MRMQSGIIICVLSFRFLRADFLFSERNQFPAKALKSVLFDTQHFLKLVKNTMLDDIKIVQRSHLFVMRMFNAAMSLMETILHFIANMASNQPNTKGNDNE